MTVARQTLADHRACQDIERGEEGGRTVPLVVMGHCSGSAPFHRQTALRPVQGLSLALFVHAQIHSQRIKIEFPASRPSTFAAIHACRHSAESCP